MLIDIKREIAKHDDQVWYRLWRYTEFRSYASSYAGRREYVTLFTVVDNQTIGTLWLLFDIKHRIDGPAIVYAYGTQMWYQNGQLHRDNDLPAIVHVNGDQTWYQHGRLYRDNNQPAVISADGGQYWYQNGHLHRDDDLPAAVYANGDKLWFRNGEQHRDNGPAAVYADGYQEWYQNDRLLFTKMIN